METVYACTHVTKHTEVDDSERGCDPDTYQCQFSNPCDVTSDTLAGLVGALEERFGLALDDLFLPEEGRGLVTRFGFSRLENDQGDPPEDDEVSRWRAGGLVLYVASYDFEVEHRAVSAIEEEEFMLAGIKFH